MIVENDNKWPLEFWCNGELQIASSLTAKQVQAITYIIAGLGVQDEK